jgi:peptide/nickel transport system substrate-binding protein
MALFIKMNDLPVKDGVIIPLISRPRVRGINAKLTTQLTGWDLDLSGLHNWFREA